MSCCSLRQRFHRNIDVQTRLHFACLQTKVECKTVTNGTSGTAIPLNSSHIQWRFTNIASLSMTTHKVCNEHACDACVIMCSGSFYDAAREKELSARVLPTAAPEVAKTTHRGAYLLQNTAITITIFIITMLCQDL